MKKIPDEKRLVFKIGFKCKCGETDKTRFLFETHEVDEKSIYLLCMTCERRYVVQLISKEVK